MSNKKLTELNFEISEAEFSRGHQIHLRRAFFNLKNLILVSMALAIASIQAQIFGETSWVVALFMGVWALVIGLMGMSYWILPSRLYRTRADYAAEHSLKVTQSGLSYHFGSSKEVYDWASFHRSVENWEFLLVYCTGARFPILIPKRVFDTSEDLVDFKKILEDQDQ